MTTGRDRRAELLDEYDELLPQYQAFARKLEQLINEVLVSEQVRVHSVSSRVKDRASLEVKLSRPDSNYARLDEITDLVGIRIITHFANDVDVIAPLMKREFSVDPASSVDKRLLLAPDRFGYLSLHYVLTLTPERCTLTEYRKFDGINAEIQIRSILQHAWAEIEHDLGYKTELSIPAFIRRRFSRLAGLLEVADDEFGRLRVDLVDYESRIRTQIASAPFEVEIDKASLGAYVTLDETVSMLDNAVAHLMGAELVPPGALLDEQTARFLAAGVSNIGQLRGIMDKWADRILRFSKVLLAGAAFEQTERGISLYYLVLVVAADAGEDAMRAFVEERRPGDPSNVATAADFLASYRKSQATDGG